MSNNKGTLVTATVKSFSDQDTFPVVDSKDVKGGYQTVQTLVERNAIPLEKRSVGFLVKVNETSTIYHWDGTTFDNNLKQYIGLSNVDNTSDLSKPISTATQAVLDTKVSYTEYTNGSLYKGAYNVATNTPTLTGTPNPTFNDGDYYEISKVGQITFSGSNFASGTTLNVGDKLKKKSTSWELLPIGTQDLSNLYYTDNLQANLAIKELYVNFGTTNTVLSDIKSIRILKNDTSVGGIYSISFKNASNADVFLFFYTSTNQTGTEIFNATYQGITAYIVVNWSAVNNGFNSYVVNLKQNCLTVGLSPRIKQYIDISSTNTNLATNTTNIATANTNIAKINANINNILYTDNENANAIIKELHLDFGTTSSTLSDVKSIRILKNDSSVGGIYSIALKKADNTDLFLFFYTNVNQTNTELFYANSNGIKGYIVVNWSVVTNQFNSFTVNLKSNCLVAGLSPRIKQYIDITTTNANVIANTNSISSNTTSITAINGIISNISFSNNLTFNSIFKEFYIDFGVTGIDISVITKVRILKGNLVNGVPIWSISLRKTDNTELILFFYSTTDQTGTEYFTMNTNGIKAYIIVAWNAVLNTFTELTNLVLNNNCLSFNFNPTIQAKIASSNPTTTLEYFSEEVLQQNYFDDLSDGMSQMLRTDKIVLNQGNLGLTSGNKSLYNTLRYTANDDKSLIHYQYISWIDVQEVANTYLFETAITPILQNNANTGKRTVLRIFPASFSGNKNVTYTHLSKLTNTVQTNKIQFPTYVADLMDTNSGQFAEYEGYWLLDVNLDSVYTEYQKLMQAFSTWLNTKTLTVNGNTVNAKDLILYFEFGLIGPFGEGNWFGVDFTTSVANVTRYYNDVMTLLPNFIIASGMDVWGELGSKKEELFKATKKLQNNNGYLGTFIDHIGSYDPKVFASDSATQKQLDYYVARGDFFTGEFATFPKNPYWGGSSGLWTYSLFTKLKMPYVRINNISYQIGFTMYSIGQVSPQTMYQINNCLSIVGFRYVLSNIYSTVTSGLLKIEFELSNIGLNKCFFDIYKMYYRIKNLDTLAITDVEITYDLRTLLPKNRKPGQFAIGNGQSFTLENINVSSLSAYSVSLIIKDKINLQNPLYLSNYNRQADGSYLLYTNVVS